MPVVIAPTRAPLTPDVVVPPHGQRAPLTPDNVLVPQDQQQDIEVTDLEERVFDVEGGVQLALREIRKLRVELVDLQAEAADLRADAAVLRADVQNLGNVVHWFQRVYNWMAAAARTFPWH
jgi:hypothetical protein